MDFQPEPVSICSHVGENFGDQSESKKRRPSKILGRWLMTGADPTIHSKPWHRESPKHGISSGCRQKVKSIKKHRFNSTKYMSCLYHSLFSNILQRKPEAARLCLPWLLPGLFHGGALWRHWQPEPGLRDHGKPAETITASDQRYLAIRAVTIQLLLVSKQLQECFGFSASQLFFFCCILWSLAKTSQEALKKHVESNFTADKMVLAASGATWVNFWVGHGFKTCSKHVVQNMLFKTCCSKMFKTCCSKHVHWDVPFSSIFDIPFPIPFLQSKKGTHFFQSLRSRETCRLGEAGRESLWWSQGQSCAAAGLRLFSHVKSTSKMEWCLSWPFLHWLSEIGSQFCNLSLGSPWKRKTMQAGAPQVYSTKPYFCGAQVPEIESMTIQKTQAVSNYFLLGLVFSIFLALFYFLSTVFFFEFCVNFLFELLERPSCFGSHHALYHQKVTETNILDSKGAKKNKQHHLFLSIGMSYNML